MLCILASGCFFSGASAARWWRLECKRLFAFYKNYFVIFCNARHNLNEFGSALIYAKSVIEKNNSRVDCAEADKKTVQAQRYEGRGFLAAGDCTAELPVIN
jgi:hypothetical protein